MTDLALSGVAYAEANWGRWLARCPAPWCTNAVALERFQLEFACAGMDGCGCVTDVVWPPDPAAIELLLTMRPVPRTRNWLPGESLEDLLAENATHGIVPAGLDSDRPTVIAAIADECLVGGLLHQQLTSAARPQIGA